MPNKETLLARPSSSAVPSAFLGAFLLAIRIPASLPAVLLCAKLSPVALRSFSTAVQGASATGSCSEPLAGREEAGQ